MSWSPYEELGLNPSATAAQVKAAYRKKSKTAHPDVGGTEEAWAKVALAYAILTNADKRKVFDETGEVEEPKLNNDRAAALGVIDSHLGTIINMFIQGGCRPDMDPARIDIPLRIRAIIRHEMQEAEGAEASAEKARATLLNLMKRFKVKDPSKNPDEDPIQRSLNAQVAKIDDHLTKLRAALRVHAHAVTITENYEFDVDRSAVMMQMQTWPSTGTMGGFR
jgi:curved DNA-binding protein CbpA